MRAAVLGDHPVLRQESGRGHPFHRVGGLRDERGGLGTPRFLGTVGSVSNWARPHDEHSHICSGYTGSGPGSSARGK